MPCVYYESEQEKAESRKKAQEEHNALVERANKADKYKKELDKVTRIACGLTQALEENKATRNELEKQMGSNLFTEWDGWWREHREMDEAREKEEALQKEIDRLHAEMLQLKNKKKAAKKR